jgi:hypothetical protein
MFTENEIDALVSDQKIKDITESIKTEFIEQCAPYLEITNHDFLSLALLTPTIGVALSNGSVSLIEEMTLNKKARKLSKGGYWMKKDPVIIAMGHLINNFDDWSDKFLDYLKQITEFSYKKEELMYSHVADEGVSDEDFILEVLRAPFMFIRFLSSFFQNDEDEDFVSERNVSSEEYNRMKYMAKRIGIDEIPIFKKYMSKMIVK